MALDATDRAIVRATQAGLPLCREPYRAVAEQLGLSAEDILARLERLLASGVIRRIGAVPNHYALGYRANGMSVWDVDDAAVSELGHKVGALPAVSHCYRRPRRPPAWPYNLFAMVHGRSRGDKPGAEPLVGQRQHGAERAPTNDERDRAARAAARVRLVHPTSLRHHPGPWQLDDERQPRYVASARRRTGAARRSPWHAPCAVSPVDSGEDEGRGRTSRPAHRPRERRCALWLVRWNLLQRQPFRLEGTVLPSTIARRAARV